MSNKQANQQTNNRENAKMTGFIILYFLAYVIQTLHLIIQLSFTQTQFHEIKCKKQ